MAPGARTSIQNDAARRGWQNPNMNDDAHSRRNAPRLYCAGPLAPGAMFELPHSAAHHAVHVLRLAVGDPVWLFSGDGGEWSGQIASIHRSSVTVRVGAYRERDIEAPVRVILAQGISSRERMDFTLQKAVELGIAEFVPLQTRRSVVRLDEARAGRRVEHWRNLACAACEQCGRNRIPTVHAVAAFTDWLGALSREPSEARVILSPTASLSLRELPVQRSVLLLVGPEGGLSPDEQDLASRFDFQSVRLGPRILRTETAALAALAAMHALWGDF